MALTKVTNNILKSGAAVSNIGYTPVNKAGDTMTGRLNIQNGGYGGLILNKGQGNERVTPEMYSLPIYTEYVGATYINRMAKIGQFLNNGSSSVICGKIMRHGDYSYAQLYMVIEFEAHVWGAQSSVFDFAGKEITSSPYSGQFSTDSSGNLYYYDGMLWEQNTYLYIYDTYNFNLSISSASYNSSLPWRTVSNSAQTSYEVNFGA